MVPTEDPMVIQGIFQQLFDRLFALDEMKGKFQGINKVVKIKYDHPEVTMYLDFKDEASKVIFLPDGELDPAATLEMDWETAHKLWSGKLDLMPALLTERLRVAGEVEQLVSLRSMYREATAIYKEIIESVS
jgi:putative sterol carrier protein